MTGNVASQVRKSNVWWNVPQFSRFCQKWVFHLGGEKHPPQKTA